MIRQFENCLKVIPTLMFAGIVNAQVKSEEPKEMVTDRPDATESSSVVPKGTLQFETGGAYTSFMEDGIKSERLVYNTTLLRYGLLNNLELRMGWDYAEQTTAINRLKSEISLIGLSPLLLGMKLAIAKEKNGWPEMAFLGHLYIPFLASTDFRPANTGADFRFSLSHTLSEKSVLGYNLGAEWGADSAEIAYVYSISYGYRITNTLGCYAELYGDLPEASKANHFWNAGFTYLIKPRIQFDVTVGSSITKGQDILLSMGLSFRIPD